MLAILTTLLAVTVLPTPGSVVGPGGLPSPGKFGPTPSLSLAPTPSLATTISLGATPSELAPTFWGTTVSPRVRLFSYESSLVEATPARTIVWPGGNMGDDYDPFTNLIWSSTNTFAVAPTSEAQFATWCESIHCQAIIQVPGEVDNASLAAQVVAYTEQTLGLHPSAWEIGNEPAFWRHWGQPWASWSTTVAAPNSTQYAEEVQQYLTHMRQVDPSLSLVGLPGIGKPLANDQIESWVSDMIRVNGPNLSAVSVHIYPDPSYTNDTLAQYYATLLPSNPLSISARVPYDEKLIRTDVTKWCPATCGPIALTVTELGSAISSRPDAFRFAIGFPGAVFMAAQMTQAMSFNLTNVDDYATALDTGSSWFTQNGSGRPLYVLESEVMNHLGSTAFPVSFSGGPSGLYGIATTDPTDGNRSDLLVVNTNLSTSASFTPVFPGSARSTPVELWAWENNSTRYPVAQYSPGAVGSFVLPPNSLVVFEQGSTARVPVRFSETGLTDEARWYLGVGGSVLVSVSPNLTAFLAPGNYPLASGPGVSRASLPPPEFWECAPVAAITVGAGGLNVNIPYFVEVPVHLASRPAYGGAASPSVTAWRLGVPLDIDATAATGWLFRQWVGGGAGNYSGPAASVRVVPEGGLNETAVFDRGFLVTFGETGLPTSTVWQVDVGGSFYTTNQSSLSILLANGTHDYTLPSVGGYDAKPSGGSFTVGGAPVGPIPIVFVARPGGDATTFQESGLPMGTNWSISLGGSRYSSLSSTITAFAANGTYGYTVAGIPGYAPSPASGTVLLAGGPAEITVRYEADSGSPDIFPVEFAENGLPASTAWAVRVSGYNGTATGASGTGPDLAVYEPNGTYLYHVEVSGNLTASPTSGSYRVAGESSVAIRVAFTPTATAGTVFSQVWEEAGLDPGTSWSVTVRYVTYASTTDRIVVPERPGDYGYTVRGVPGYLASVERGGFQVGNTTPAPIPVSFLAAASVTVVALGLPTGLHWFLRIGVASASESATRAGFVLPRGNWTFEVVAPAHFDADPDSGNLSLAGLPVNLTIRFLPALVSSPPISAATTALLRAVTVALVLGATGGLSAWLMTRGGSSTVRMSGRASSGREPAPPRAETENPSPGERASRAPPKVGS